MRRRRTRLKPQDKVREKEPFCSELRVDPVMENDPRLQGLGVDGVEAKGALFLYCWGTTIVGVRSLRSKEAKYMEEAIRSFKGKNDIGYAYTDQCRSLAKGMRNMSYAWRVGAWDTSDQRYDEVDDQNHLRGSKSEFGYGGRAGMLLCVRCGPLLCV